MSRWCAVGLLLLLTACGPESSGVTVSAPNSGPTIASDPLRLVGMWSVTGDGVQSGTVLRLGDDLEVFLPCGILDGDWQADAEQSLFLASTHGGDSTCFPTAQRVTVPWLDAAAGFRIDDGSARLLDVDGRTLVVLHPGAQPTAGPNRIASAADPPTISPSHRAELAEPRALPSGVSAPTAADVQGRWVPRDTVKRPKAAYVTFSSDGTYLGSDGCNGSGGRYVLGRQGRLLATSGPSTLIGCNNSPVDTWPSQSSRVGLRGEALVFFDMTGTELGEVVSG